MTVRQMRYLPDPILRQKSVALKNTDLEDPSIQKLIDDMIESMHHYSAVGIAANQSGSRYRICIIQRPEDELPYILINPRITRREGERELTEGCLSLPGFQGRIIRSTKVWAKALDRTGNPISFNAETGLLAQALEHETDHLSGIAYIDHVRTTEDLYRLEPSER